MPSPIAPSPRPGADIVGLPPADRAASDEALFEGVRAGSETHFGVLYDRYFQRIYRYVHTRVRNHADAEELTQEAFTQVFRSIDGYSGRSTPIGWIYGIAKNTIHSHLRRIRLRGDKLEAAGFEGVTLEPEGVSTPEAELLLRQYVEEIDRGLSGVAAWQAEAFFLRHVENLGITEIARRVKRSNDAVRSSLYRTKRMLVEAGRGEESTSAP